MLMFFSREISSSNNKDSDKPQQNLLITKGPWRLTLMTKPLSSSGPLAHLQKSLMFGWNGGSSSGTSLTDGGLTSLIYRNVQWRTVFLR